MALFWKKEQLIINKIISYLDEIDICRDRFRECMELLITSGLDEEGKKMVEDVHQAESRADDIRREIELDLYMKALIPESRGDVLGVLENLDDIPGLFQSICYQMSSQKIEIPEEFRRSYLSLIDVNIDSYNLIREVVLGFFYKKDVKTQIDQIDAEESKSDRIERDLITDIFDSTIDKADKILLKEIVVNIGDISDIVQVTSDRLTLAIIKRKI